VIGWLTTARPKKEPLSKFLEELLQVLESREQAETAIRDGQEDNRERKDSRGARSKQNAYLVDEENEEREEEYHDDASSYEDEDGSDEETQAQDQHYAAAYMVKAEEGKFRPIHEVVKQGESLGDKMVRGGIPFECFYARGPSVCWSCGCDDHWSYECPTPNPKLPFGPKNHTVMLDKSNTPHMFGEPLLDKEGGAMRLSDHGKINAAKKVEAARAEKRVDDFKNRRRRNGGPGGNGKSSFGRGPR